MRGTRIAALAAAALLAGCGAEERTAAPAATSPTATPDATDINRDSQAAPLVYLYKIVGDDPMPYQVTVRDDRTAAVVYGGGHTGGNDKAIRLSAAQAARAERLIAAVPWRKLKGHTVDPGGFGGNDNMVRYMLRRRGVSTTYTADDMPVSLARLVKLLDRIIDGELGTEVASDSHYSSNGGIIDEG